MSYVLHRSLLKEPLYAAKGEGMYVIGQNGERYLDGCGGAAVSCLGHNHAAVIEAIRKQAGTLPYAHTAFFTTTALEELGETLVGLAPGMDKVMLFCGGSEAMEAALKLSRQYFVERGEMQRELFIARRQSYHGNTLGVLGIGGNEWRREMFEPLLKQVIWCHPVSSTVSAALMKRRMPMQIDLRTSLKTKYRSSVQSGLLDLLLKQSSVLRPGP